MKLTKIHKVLHHRQRFCTDRQHHRCFCKGREYSHRQSSLHRYRRRLSAVVLLGHRRDRSNEVAVYRKLLLLLDDNPNQPARGQSGLLIHDIPQYMAQQVRMVRFLLCIRRL
jgi:hypothetical protein